MRLLTLNPLLSFWGACFPICPEEAHLCFLLGRQICFLSREAFPIAPDLQGGGKNGLAKEKLRFSELERQEGSWPSVRLCSLTEQKASTPARGTSWADPLALWADTSATSLATGQVAGWGAGGIGDTFLLLLWENELLGGEVQDGFINRAENVFSCSKIYFPRKHNYSAKTTPGSLRIRVPRNGMRQLILSKKKSGEFKMA